MVSRCLHPETCPWDDRQSGIQKEDGLAKGDGEAKAQQYAQKPSIINQDML
jgi:hypothetical protein